PVDGRADDAAQDAVVVRDVLREFLVGFFALPDAHVLGRARDHTRAAPSHVIAVMATINNWKATWPVESSAAPTSPSKAAAARLSVHAATRTAAAMRAIRRGATSAVMPLAIWTTNSGPGALSLLPAPIAVPSDTRSSATARTMPVRNTATSAARA